MPFTWAVQHLNQMMIKRNIHKDVQNAKPAEITDTCVDSHTFLSFLALSAPRSDTTGLWSVSLVLLGLVSRSLLQRWCSSPHSLHPFAAGQCWDPLPWAGGTGWVCTTQLYETPVTHRVHCYGRCQYSTLTLMLSLLDWEMLLHLEHLLDNAEDCFVFVTAKLGGI